jgi:hypothetical protein
MAHVALLELEVNALNILEVQFRIPLPRAIGPEFELGLGVDEPDVAPIQFGDASSQFPQVIRRHPDCRSRQERSKAWHDGLDWQMGKLI